MADIYVSAANLEQFREELAIALAQEIGGGSGSSSNYVPIRLVASDREDGQMRLYLAVAPDFDVNTVSLRFVRRSTVKDVDRSVTPKVVRRYKGWHQVLAVPQKRKQPLYNDGEFWLKNKWCEVNGKALYEVRYDDEEVWVSLMEYVIDGGGINGYYYRGDNGIESVTIEMLFSTKRCGFCLVKDGKVISNVAAFQLVYNDFNEPSWRVF